jgi:hypothetical protein
MSKVEDYPGPTKDQPEKEAVEWPANEGIVGARSAHVGTDRRTFILILQRET